MICDDVIPSITDAALAHAHSNADASMLCIYKICLETPSHAMLGLVSL